MLMRSKILPKQVSIILECTRLSNQDIYMCDYIVLEELNQVYFSLKPTSTHREITTLCIVLYRSLRSARPLRPITLTCPNRCISIMDLFLSKRNNKVRRSNKVEVCAQPGQPVQSVRMQEGLVHVHLPTMLPNCGIHSQLAYIVLYRSLRSARPLRPITLTIPPDAQNFNHDHSPRPWSQHHPGTELDQPRL